MNPKLLNHINKYIGNLNGNTIGLLIQKNCGYEWFTIVNNDISLSQLYFHIEMEIKNYHGIKLFNFGEELIPRHPNMKFRDYIQEKYSHFTPVYSLPDPVIYRIKIDDGINHFHH